MTNDIDWYTTLHNYAGYMRALKKKGTKTYSVNPVYNDTAEYMKSEWVAVNPGTDTAVMAAMIYELEVTGEADHAFLDKYTAGWKEFRANLMGDEDGGMGCEDFRHQGRNHQSPRARLEGPPHDAHDRLGDPAY